MLRLKSRQRAVLIEKLPDAANLAAGALLFGQFISGQPFSLRLALAGLAVWAALMAITLAFAGAD